MGAEEMALYAAVEQMDEAGLLRLRALSDYTRLSRVPLPQMTLDQLVQATDAARVLLRTETLESVRDILLDSINQIDQECRKRNADQPQRVEGALAVGDTMRALARAMEQ